MKVNFRIPKTAVSNFSKENLMQTPEWGRKLLIAQVEL
jgi:hypothetical protein